MEHPSLFDPLNVSLDVYSGPLDLLLELIQGKKLDIFTVPLREICEPYLSAIRGIDVSDFERAGEFMAMAATLILIKSRSLLPVEKTNPESSTEAEADPEEELRRRLIEYKAFKELSEKIDAMPILEREVFRRPDFEEEGEENVVYQNLNLYELLKSYQGALRRAERIKPFEIALEEETVEEKAGLIIATLAKVKTMMISDLLDPEKGKFPPGKELNHFILVIIASLECARLGLLTVAQVGIDIQLTATEKTIDVADSPEALYGLFAINH